MSTNLVSIVLPVYNEINTIEKLLNDVLNFQHKLFEFEIIVIESSSSDGTHEFIKLLDTDFLHAKYKKNIKIIFQNSAKGKGFAVRQGFEHCNGNIIFIQDADLEYDINSYSPILDCFLNDKNCDLVIGKRSKVRKFGRFGVRSFYMNLGAIFFHTFFRILYGSNISDPTTMFKVFKKNLIQDLNFESNRFDFDWELICKFSRLDVNYHEIEVDYKSRGFDAGKKVGLFLDPIVWLYKIIKYRFVKI